MTRLGFTEVVMTTAHMPRLAGFYGALGWSDSPLAITPDIADYFDCRPGDDRGCLLKHPLADCTVRLLPASAETPPWRPLDTELIVPGGLFDINMRTNDSDFAVAFLREHGWSPLTDPVPWQFGESSVKEFLCIQDDGIIMAVMQRISPPLPGPAFDRMSDIFNATQIVQDHDRSLAFLQVLGFEPFVDFTGPLPGEGPRVLNLQQHSDEQGHIRLTISHPEALMQGSIEMISTPHQQRSTLSPLNGGLRGLTALRIPCADLEGVYAGLLASTWLDHLHKPLARRDLGDTEQLCFSVLSPEGARLDLFQAEGS